MKEAIKKVIYFTMFAEWDTWMDGEVLWQDGDETGVAICDFVADEDGTHESDDECFFLASFGEDGAREHFRKMGFADVEFVYGDW